VRRLYIAAAFVFIVGACTTGFNPCDQQSDVTGHWTFTLEPVDGGLPDANPIPTPDTISADLQQQPSSNLFGFGAPVWGTLKSTDPGFFATLEIPRLMMNNGSKTGAVLGCRLRINVPIEMPVNDDNVPPGPLRLSLVGRISAPHMMVGDPSSRVIRVADTSSTPEEFTWTGTQP
jgi:hypothetical protein